MAKREGQAQEAYEAGTRNVLPGQAWVQALARGLQRELFGADMGTPVGQKVQEELGSLGYEKALRAGYPEDYAQGRAAGSEWVDPLTLLAMRGTPLRAGPGRLAGPGLRPALPNGQVFDGEVLSPRMAIEAGPHLGGNPPQRFAGPTNQFERNAVSGAQIGRRGFGYGYEAPSYWEEGGQGFRPSIDDFVPLDVVRNDAQYFDRVAQDQASALGRQGRNAEALHPLYGPNANRPNYGAEPGGDYVSPIARRPAPGVRQMPGGPAPFGQGGEGKGYFGNLPNPGIRSDVRQEIGQGAGMPRLRYEPVGQGGLPMMAQGGMPAVRGSVAPGYDLPAMAGGRGLVPTEIQGEFVEVPGLDYVPRGGGWNGSMNFGVSGGGSQPGRGMNYGPAIAAALGLGTGYMTGGREQSDLPAWNPSINSDVGPMGIGEMYPLNPLTGEQPVDARPRQKSAPAARTAKAPASRSAKAPVAQTAKKPSNKSSVQEPGWEPNLNYLVTQALDELFGQNEAERGRKTQQYYEKNPY